VQSAHKGIGTQGGWSSQDAILVAKLEPSGVRGDEMAEITVPSGVRWVQLVLDVPPALHGKTQVQLLDDTGHVVTAASGVEPQQINGKRVLIATFSAQFFPTANYFVDVVGEGPAATHARYALKVLVR
jgi:hypothetical protein